MSRVSNRQARQKIIDMENFASHTGNFHGSWGGDGTFGRLPQKWRDRYPLRMASCYVVYSYSTPIAWWDATTGWVIPDVKYSPTTSRHQSNVRLAVGR